MPAAKTGIYDFLVITGPTASGKTELAARVAAELGAEIISADSRQVYRGMDIGTGKDLGDYTVDGKVIPVHLIDIAHPGYKYNVFEFQHDFAEVYSSLRSRNIFPIVCGGSGLYIDSIVSGYRMLEVPPNPSLRAELENKPIEELTEILRSMRPLHNRTDTDSRKRAIRAIEIEIYSRAEEANQSSFPELKPLVTGISIDRETRRANISKRLRQRLDSGMVEEVRALLEKGVKEEILIYYGLEYKYITLYLTGRLTHDEMVASLEIAIHQFAKRQMTWFRGMEKKGTMIHWIDGSLQMARKIEIILGLLRNNPI